MERLCALVPRPRKHLVTYHGVLAPASGLRSRVVPRREGDAGDVGGCRHGDDGGAAASADLDGAVVAAGVDLRRRLAEWQRRQRLRAPHCDGRRSGARRRLPWAAGVAKTVIQRPPAEAWSAEDSAMCCARSESRCWSARSAPGRGGCWLRSTTRRRSPGCWGRWGSLDRNRGRLRAGRHRVGKRSVRTASPAGRSDGEARCGGSSPAATGEECIRWAGEWAAGWENGPRGGGFQPFAKACRMGWGGVTLRDIRPGWSGTAA